MKHDNFFRFNLLLWKTLIFNTRIVSIMIYTDYISMWSTFQLTYSERNWYNENGFVVFNYFTSTLTSSEFITCKMLRETKTMRKSWKRYSHCRHSDSQYTIYNVAYAYITTSTYVRPRITWVCVRVCAVLIRMEKPLASWRVSIVSD